MAGCAHRFKPGHDARRAKRRADALAHAEPASSDTRDTATSAMPVAAHEGVAIHGPRVGQPRADGFFFGLARDYWRVIKGFP